MLLKRKADGVICNGLISDARTNVIIQQLQVLTRDDPFRDPVAETVSLLAADGTVRVAPFGALIVRPADRSEETSIEPSAFEWKKNVDLSEQVGQDVFTWHETVAFADAYEVIG